MLQFLKSRRIQYLNGPMKVILSGLAHCHIAAMGEKNRQVCPHQSMATIQSLTIFAGDQIRSYRRVKSPGVSPA